MSCRCAVYGFLELKLQAVKARGKSLDSEVSIVVEGKNQAAIMPVTELVTKLSPKNIRMAGSIVRRVLTK